ncbi:MAG: hypothetical protein ACREEB_00740 [Caulobacteraceae bacterium]
MSGGGRALFRPALALGLAALLIWQPLASTGALALVGGGTGANDKADVCAVDRAPILERKKQYDAVRRSRLGKSVGAGLEKGAGFFASAMLHHYLPGFGARTGGFGFGLLSRANLSEASQLSIPGVTVPAGAGVFGRRGLGQGDMRAAAAMAVVVAIAGTVEAYVKLKQQEANGDAVRMANSIDGDAANQIDVSRALASEETTLGNCRAREVAAYQGRLSSASNQSDRQALGRDRAALQNSIHKDVDLEGGVVNEQAGLAKTYTQGRAMSEGTSEAHVLGGQAPAYEARASTTPLKLPPADNKGGGSPAAAQAAPVWVTARASVLRADASARGQAVTRLAAGTEVKMDESRPAARGWYAVTVGNQAGFLMISEVTRGTPSGPRLAPPTNIREHNAAVIAARDQGPNRLNSLLTDVQAKQLMGGRVGKA